MLKPFVELQCDQLETISIKMMQFINDKIESRQEGWCFLNTKDVIDKIPELVMFFKKYKLYPMDSAVTILYDDLDLHVDPMPVIAKINIPISNTLGWVNRWYNITEEQLANTKHMVDRFGQTKENIDDLKLDLLAELHDLSQPIVFNSRLAHSVVKLNPTATPRVIASFTFHNQPLSLLQ